MPLLHNPALALAIWSPQEPSTGYIMPIWTLLVHFPSPPSEDRYIKYHCISTANREALGFSNHRTPLQQELSVAVNPRLQRASSRESELGLER